MNPIPESPADGGPDDAPPAARPRFVAGADAALGGVLFATAGAGAALVDRALCYVRVNDALAAMNGIPAAAHAGRRVRDVLPPAAADVLEPPAAVKGIAYEHVPCSDQMIVRADPGKLRQVVLNLLSNAMKFTLPDGRVRLWCAGGPTAVTVSVHDTGIGIPADQLEAIFQPFVQLDQGLTRTAEGTGLGLAISRDLARGMGGDLTVESTLGGGSTFTLTLPRA